LSEGLLYCNYLSIYIDKKILIVEEGLELNPGPGQGAATVRTGSIAFSM